MSSILRVSIKFDFRVLNNLMLFLDFGLKFSLFIDESVECLVVLHFKQIVASWIVVMYWTDLWNSAWTVAYRVIHPRVSHVDRTMVLDHSGIVFVRRYMGYVMVNIRFYGGHSLVMRGINRNIRWSLHVSVWRSWIEGSS